MKKYLWIICIITIFWNLQAINTRIIKQDKDYISFEIDLSSLNYDEKGDFFTISNTEMQIPNSIGSPKIPYLSYNIAVPADGSINVNIQNIDQETLTLHKALCPVQNEYYQDGTLHKEYNIDKNAYENYSPLAWKTDALTSFREYKIIPLKIYPIAYKHKDKKLIINRKLVVNVKISGSTNQKNALLSDWESLYSSVILNWDSAKYFTNLPNRGQVTYSPFNLSDNWYSFKINKDGIYAITKTDLNALPIDDIDPRELRIFSDGGALQSVKPGDLGTVFEEIPILINGEEDGAFDSNDILFLFAQDRDGYGMNYELGKHITEFDQLLGDFFYYNPYSAENTYWITWGGNFTNDPLRIQNIPNTISNPTIVQNCETLIHVESESVHPSEEEKNMFLWFSQKLDGTSTAEYNLSFNVKDLDTNANSNFDLMVKAEDYLNHKLITYVNNTLISEYSWSHNSMRKISANNVPYIEGTNNLKLKIIRNGEDNIFLDFFDVSYNKKLYKRNEPYLIKVNNNQINANLRYQFLNKPDENITIFKINRFNEVYKINPNYSSSSFSFDANGLATTLYYVVQNNDYQKINSIKKEQVVDLSASLEQFDYIIVCPKSFENPANELKTFYQEKYQTKAKITFQEDIFNQFSSGNPDPIAIKKYLKYAFDNYPSPKIKGVCLLGLGTNDWRNHSGVASEKNKLINAGNVLDNNLTSYYNNSSSSDQYFAYFNQNHYPEIAVGRIPIINQNEWDTYFNKMASYNETYNGTWRNRALFLADDNIYKTGLSDTEHTYLVETMTGTIDPIVKKTKIFSAEYDLDEFRKKPQVKQLFIKEINDGALFSTYIGHGSYSNIGDEQYLSMGDVSQLNNLDKLTVFIAGSCSVGLSDSPYHKSLSETMTLHPNGGAIVSIAALRETWGDANSALITPILKGSLNQFKNIGESFMAACVNAQSINTLVYQLLGDPLSPTIPPNRISNLIAVSDTMLAPNTFQSRQLVTLNGDYSNPAYNGEIDVFVNDSKKDYVITVPGMTAAVSKDGKNIYKGSSHLISGSFNANFIVPDDIIGQNSGKAYAYYQDTINKKDYINALYPISFAGHNYISENNDAPLIKIYLESKRFRDGDKVSSVPMLIAEISDENGINILGSPGHEIMLVLDNSTNPLVVTEGFSYDQNSYTKGTLYWQLEKLEAGEHSACIIAFDNFNRPSVSKVDFTVVQSSNISMDKLLIYPNPVKKDAYFTFNITEDAEVSIQIFTITGRKIKTLKQNYCAKGYNQIYWDAKDDDGDKIANNTYFYKIKAKQKSNGKSIEKVEKLMILN